MCIIDTYIFNKCPFKSKFRIKTIFFDIFFNTFQYFFSVKKALIKRFKIIFYIKFAIDICKCKLVACCFGNYYKPIIADKLSLFLFIKINK
ncbi:hypothetical protein HYN43_005325 [Mucilaginibacter celer]|uniref:Uncharacterized protein n=1 Tax=Mucilaginibacter celer TaxID=2305508 RepID=A0A494VTR8_9SPHI|nr:hypothetical protein HYN43_005325 [Mucilaginibacter celer]